MPYDGRVVAPVARRMREVLRGGEGWTQGALERDGKYCLFGAYFIATQESVSGYCRLDDAIAAHKILRRAITGIDDSGLSVDEWNDRRDRQWSDIARVIDALEEIEVRDAATQCVPVLA